VNEFAATCSDTGWLSVAEFVMRWVVALGGWGVAFFLWNLRREQARRIADHTEINKAIDSALEQIEKVEDLVIQFWSDSESKILPQQITSNMTTCAFYVRQISRLSNEREYPSKELSDVRRAATLNMEQDERGIDHQRERLGRIVTYIAKLRKAEILQKRPFSG